MYQHSGRREARKLGRVVKLSFPPARLRLLEVPQPSKRVPPSGVQVFKYRSIWEHFISNHSSLLQTSPGPPHSFAWVHYCPHFRNEGIKVYKSYDCSSSVAQAQGLESDRLASESPAHASSCANTSLHGSDVSPWGQMQTGTLLSVVL